MASTPQIEALHNDHLREMVEHIKKHQDLWQGLGLSPMQASLPELDAV